MSNETTDDCGQVPYETGCLVKSLFQALNKEYFWRMNNNLGNLLGPKLAVVLIVTESHFLDL